MKTSTAIILTIGGALIIGTFTYLIINANKKPTTPPTTPGAPTTPKTGTTTITNGIGSALSKLFSGSSKPNYGSVTTNDTSSTSDGGFGVNLSDPFFSAPSGTAGDSSSSDTSSTA